MDTLVDHDAQDGDDAGRIAWSGASNSRGKRKRAGHDF
jgi:hypothetical protein